MVAIPDAHTSPACPICGQADVVRKVSVAFAEGHIPLPKRSPLHLGPARRIKAPPKWMGGTPQMALAARLSPPERPEHHGVFASSDGQGLNTQALFLAALRYALLAGAAALLLFSLLPASTSREGIGWAVFAFLLVLLLVRRAILDRSRSERARQAVPCWEEEMDLWQRLFYCARDDRVFEPGSGRMAEVEEWRTLSH